MAGVGVFRLVLVGWCCKNALMMVMLQKFFKVLLMKTRTATGTSAIVLFSLVVATIGLNIVRSKHPGKLVCIGAKV